MPSTLINPVFPIEPIQHTAVDNFGIILDTFLPSSDKYSVASTTLSPASKSAGLKKGKSPP